MRPFYFILKFTLAYTLRVQFRKITSRNAPKKYGNQSILVLNHPSSFMDPLVVSEMQKPVVFFMTRSDVFKPAIKWFLWMVHMLPIYRARDGQGAVEKNEEVFRACHEIVRGGRSVLIFGEGLTDDKFVRRLKPVKKGTARIAFGAMERYNWDFDLQIQCVGINYENPWKLRTSAIICNSEPIHVRDYKEIYDENPNLAIVKVTAEVEKRLKDQVVHVENYDWCDTHEHILQFTRKGMNHESHDASLTLDQRQRYSKNLANYLNEMNEEETARFLQLKKRLDKYFRVLKRVGLAHEQVFEINKKGKLSTVKHWAHLLFGWPLFIMGCIHMGIPYWITKKFVEGKMKRPVFWSSVKMILGKFIGGIYNLIFIWAFYHLVYESWWLAIAYYIAAPGNFFIYAHYYSELFKDLLVRNKINKTDTKAFVERFKELEVEVKEFVPVTIN